jgi:hypothetical protein
MVETSKPNNTETTQNLSEAERMLRIRDLLVGPESAKRDESVGQINQSLADQSALIAALTARVGDLEREQRAETARLDLRLLGIVESLLTDEPGLRMRLAKSDRLRAYLGELGSTVKGPEKSG